MMSSTGTLLGAGMTGTSPRIDAADALLREAMKASLPEDREAALAIVQARDYLAEELDIHARLLNDSVDGLGWEEYDADLEWFESDPQQAAIESQEGRVHDAALALRNTLARYLFGAVASYVGERAAG